jgi:O-antigen/teichoic acid export membrane protein
MKSGNAILRNATALVAAQLISKAVNIAVSLVLVRWLGPLELGRYAYILAFCFPFGAVADFGLATLAIREISRDRSREAVVVATLGRLFLALSGLSALAMLAVAVLTRHDTPTLFGIAIVGMSSLLSALTTPSLVALTAREEMYLLSLHRIASSVLGSLATLAVLLAGGKVLPLLLAAAGTNVLMLALGRLLAGRPGLVPRAPASAVRTMLRQAVPLGLMMVGFALYYRVDMVMLQWLRGTQDVGLYAAAYRFLDTILVLAASLGGPFFPRLSNLVGRDPGQARALLEDAWRPLLALGLPLSLGTFLLADELTLVLFGSGFGEAAGLLRVLIWGALPIFWVNVANHGLIAADWVRPLAVVYGSSALVNIAANLILIPSLGGLGASLATVLCEWMNLVLVVRLIRRRFGLSVSVEGLWRYGLAAAGMATALWTMSGSGLGVQIPLAMATYGGILIVLGYLRSPDMIALRRLLAH